MGKVGAIVFPDIYFKSNSTFFLSLKDKRKIKEMLTIMNDNPTFVIEITGHCDSEETRYSDISLRRAKKVFALFNKKGIEKDRMKIVGCDCKRSKFNGSEHKTVLFSVLRKDYISPNAIRIK